MSTLCGYSVVHRSGKDRFPQPPLIPETVGVSGFLCPPRGYATGGRLSKNFNIAGEQTRMTTLIALIPSLRG